MCVCGGGGRGARGARRRWASGGGCDAPPAHISAFSSCGPAGGSAHRLACPCQCIVPRGLLGELVGLRCRFARRAKLRCGTDKHHRDNCKVGPVRECRTIPNRRLWAVTEPRACTPRNVGGGSDPPRGSCVLGCVSAQSFCSLVSSSHVVICEHGPLWLHAAQTAYRYFAHAARSRSTGYTHCRC